ncbi:MAG TPA: cytochrome c3 family protein [Candidatus Methanoperedens sp.]
MLVKSIIAFFALFGFILFIIPQANAENSCVACHRTLTPFIEEQQRFNQYRIEHLERNIACSLECHEDRVRQLATANYQQWTESAHYLKGITCEYCHGGDPNQTTKEKAHANIKNVTDTESPVFYTNVPKTCGKCHTKELTSFEGSKHYQKLEALKLAPTCTTCHAPHTFKVMNPEDFRYSCGNCHSVTKKVAPYDIPVQAEYLLGKVNRLKFNIDMANQDIFWAKKNGTDVTQAQERVNTAVQELDNLAVLWHEFNLTHFENAVDSANRELKKAEDIVKPAATPTWTQVPRTPGFIALSVIISMLAMMYLLRKRRDE